MATYHFNDLGPDPLTTFDPAHDVIAFDSTGISAASVQLNFLGGDLFVISRGYGVGIKHIAPGDLSDGSFTFADGSKMLLGARSFSDVLDSWGRTYDLTGASGSDQVWGLEGADIVLAGAGNDYLVGNAALTRINHVSRNGGTGSPEASYRPTVSHDGRLVAFEGDWTGFKTKGYEGIIVKNMDTGALSNEHRSALGVPGGSGAGSPVLSADGRFVAFSSASSNLLGEPYSGALYDIYVASTTGSRIVRVSTASDGTLAADGRALNPDLSANGRYVTFESTSSNLVAGGSTAQTDVFFKDTVTGTTTRLSTSLSGSDGNGESINAHIAANGKMAVFQSDASNLVDNDANGYSDIFVWDAASGAVRNVTKDLVAVSSPNNGAFNPDIAVTADGDTIVVFETGRSLVAADDHNSSDIYALNVTRGTIQLVSARADGTGVGASSYDASISDDGRWVVFTSGSDSLVADDNNGYADVFVKDLVTGEIALVSRAANGKVGNQASGHAAISAGGDFIVFESGATNFASTDGNGGFSDVFRVSNPLLKDKLVGGAGNDTYVLDRADTVVEEVGGGSDLIRASFSYTLGANVENLQLTGTAAINGKGNELGNGIYGNEANNVLDGAAGGDLLRGAGGDDRLRGGAGADRLVGGSGNDVLTGGTGADTFFLDSRIGSDLITDFVSGTDKIRSALAIGDGDSVIENAAVRDAAGGFAGAAELVIFTKDASGLSLADAVATIGSASGAIATDQTRLYAIDNGHDSAVYLFKSADGDAVVSASELTLLITMTGTPSTALADYALL